MPPKNNCHPDMPAVYRGGRRAGKFEPGRRRWPRALLAEPCSTEESLERAIAAAVAIGP